MLLGLLLSVTLTRAHNSFNYATAPQASVLAESSADWLDKVSPCYGGAAHSPLQSSCIRLFHLDLLPSCSERGEWKLPSSEEFDYCGHGGPQKQFDFGSTPVLILNWLCTPCGISTFNFSHNHIFRWSIYDKLIFKISFLFSSPSPSPVAPPSLVRVLLSNLPAEVEVPQIEAFLEPHGTFEVVAKSENHHHNQNGTPPTANATVTYKTREEAERWEGTWENRGINASRIEKGTGETET